MTIVDTGRQDQAPEQPVAAIKWHEQAADLLQERADAHRWEAARLIAQELDSGKTQRQLAKEIGKGVAHVNYMSQVWRKFGVHHGEQERSFDSYYQEVKSRKTLKAAPSAPITREEAERRTATIREGLDRIDETVAYMLSIGVNKYLVAGWMQDGTAIVEREGRNDPEFVGPIRRRIFFPRLQAILNYETVERNDSVASEIEECLRLSNGESQ